MKKDTNKELNLELYKKLFLIRKSEEKIIEHYHEDEMKTPMHMSMGSEAIATGICQALKPTDQVFGTYRSHALFLAKTQDIDDFFAEMYGKDTSSLKGIGGSMHLCTPEHGFMGTSAVVASAIPVAVGCAFANKQANNGKIVAVFFGDGAIDEGTFWESINVACLMKLPVMFVCEDNGLAVHTAKDKRHGYESINEVISKFNCSVYEHDTSDAQLIYELTRTVVEKMKKTQTPSFVRLEYYRYLEHVGINEDFDDGYRSKDDFEQAKANDPISLQRAKLIKSGYSAEQINQLETDITEKINTSIRKAKQADFAPITELYREVTV